jgi:K+:H+ antiporter
MTAVDGVVMGDIAVVLLVGSALGAGCRRIGQPAVIGEILAGVALGPSLLGLLPGHLTQRIFPSNAVPYLSMISEVGLLLFMFTAGWELEGRLVRGRGRAVSSVALASLVVPFGLGMLVAPWLHSHHRGAVHASTTIFALYIGTAMAITAFPVLARILADHQLLGTRRGAMAMACAAVGDVVAWCMLVLVTTAVKDPTPARFFRTLAWTAGYLAVMALLVRPVLRAAMRRFAQPNSSRALPVIIGAGVLLSAYVTSWIGIHPIFGAFAFGIVMPREPATVLRLQVIEPLSRAAMLLLPVYFIVTGLSVDVGSVGWTGLLDLAVVVVVASTGKLAGVGLAGRVSGLNWTESFGLGVLLNTRGLTELVVLGVGLQLGVIDRQLFTVMVLMALITTAATGPLIRKHPQSEAIAEPAPTDGVLQGIAEP